MALLPYVRLIVGGHMDSSNQTWSFGTSWGCTTMPTNAQLATWLASVGTAVATYINATNGPKSGWGANVTYDTLECYAYDTGHTTAGAQANVVVTPITGATSPALPTQLALVHSLLSGFPGRKNRGRYYLPINTTAQFQSNNGQLTSAGCLAYANAAVAFFHAVSAINIGAQTIIPVVATRGSAPYVPINSIGVDSKVDTQRRRTDKEPALLHSIVAL